MAVWRMPGISIKAVSVNAEGGLEEYSKAHPDRVTASFFIYSFIGFYPDKKNFVFKNHKIINC